MRNIAVLLFPLLLLLLPACQEKSSEKKKDQPPSNEASAQLVPIEQRFGELFEAVQMARVFPDSKTFADCSPKFSDEEILANYEAQRGGENFDLKAFVDAHFNLPRQYASGFKADMDRSIEEHINALWPVLTRQADQGDRGTLIPLPHPYIVPGGRFGEIYYWDSYFTMLGLEVAEKQDMIRNMVDNFAYLIDTVGHIPNGNRTYFLGRSQPPFFAMMVELLAQSDEEAYARYYPMLRKEYDFWMAGKAATPSDPQQGRRKVALGEQTLNRYWDDFPEPRPESYAEDVELAELSDRDSLQLYRDLRAACESGWDFSSRWFRDQQNLASIHTTEILPVDLNSLLWKLESVISTAARAAGEGSVADEFQRKAEARAESIRTLFWNEAAGYFMDYDFVAGAHTPVPSLAGMFPLFMGIATPEQAARSRDKVKADFLQPGGVVTTLNATGQQWDYPNGWAPLQWVTIKGLRTYNYNSLAETCQNRWIELNRKVYQNTGKMVEKYNVTDMGLEAGGGEYPLQDGFGWSNGVLLRLLSEQQAM
jgi:alpha,alpha-trehalase